MVAVGLLPACCGCGVGTLAVCGVVLLYYRRVYVAGGCEAWWRRSMDTRDVGDGCCVGELDGPGAQMELACLLAAGSTNDVKEGLAWQQDFSLPPPHVLL